MTSTPFALRATATHTIDGLVRRTPWVPCALWALWALCVTGCNPPPFCIDEDGEISRTCPTCDVEGLELACYEGPPETAGVGPCGPGMRVCVPESPWPVCTGQVLPTVEDPATPEIDDDCDGRLDEGASIACVDCGEAVSISLAELAARGPRHPVVVRLSTPEDLLPGLSGRMAQVEARVAQVAARVVARGAPALEAIEALAVDGFTAVATIPALEILLTLQEVEGIALDYALSTQLVESGVLVHAPQVRRASAVSGAGVRVALIDTGVDYHHPTFGACPAIGAPECAVVDGWDFADDDPDPMDADGHGTHLAGVIAGRGTDALAPGVAPGAELVALRVDPAAAGFGQLARALTWVLRRGAGIRVVVVGVGTTAVYATGRCIHADRFHEGPRPGEDPPPNDGLIRRLLDELEQAGIAVVFASGNGGDAYRMSYPACLPGVVAVGAVYDADAGGAVEHPLDPIGEGAPAACIDDPALRDRVACFSNGNPAELDLVAPGTPILSAAPLGAVDTRSGTSAAAAHVGGALALLFEVEPAHDAVTAMQRLRASATLRRDRRPSPEGGAFLNGYVVRRLDLASLIDRDCRDEDGDGTGRVGVDCVDPLDCDDADATVHPRRVERCDGRDDDCDGRFDEGFAIGEVCEVGVGVCARAGARVCLPDGSAGCDVEPGPPGVEACDGADDDCDGRTDEGVLNACGACGPAVEVVCNGADDDCDGRTDEGAEGVPCGDGRFFDRACNCVRNDFPTGFWFNGYSCGGVQNGFGDDEHNQIEAGDYNDFQCGVICTRVGAECCSQRDGNCYQGSASYWWSWVDGAGWHAARRGGGIPGDVRN